jgi:hypothetical protein
MAYVGVDLNIPVASVDEIIGTAVNRFDNIKLYSAATRGGTYALVTTIALVAGDTLYTYTDTAGVSSTWYKVTFFNSVTSNETELTETEPFPATRDRLTRKELRQKLVRNLAGKVFATAPSSVTSQTVVLAELIDTAADSEYYEGWHLYRPDSTSTLDADRRISVYTPASGTLTHGGSPYTDITATSEQTEIVPLDLDYVTLLGLINDGLEDTRWLYRLELSMVSGQNQYVLPNMVEGEEYVKQIWRRHGGTANSYIWKPVGMNGGWARVRGSNFRCTLDVDPSLGDNEVLALEVWRPGEGLDSETDFSPVQRKWAEASAMVKTLTFVVNQQKIRHGVTVLGDILQDWKIELRKNSRKHGPTPGMKIQLPSRMSGLPDV